MEKTYDVVVRVLHSTMVEIKASSEEEAIEKAIEDFYDGEVMPGLECYKDFFDDLDVFAEEVKLKSQYE
ncbi:hypothetical protein ACTQ5K_20080 [Niallia sp. Sow4_A1]|uniref:hypothetical protein n=1 Tax=Niallia sp. Sow4_A1 TaxID=3438793 RepID=UPI003F998358